MYYIWDICPKKAHISSLYKLEKSFYQQTSVRRRDDESTVPVEEDEATIEGSEPRMKYAVAWKYWSSTRRPLCGIFIRKLFGYRNWVPIQFAQRAVERTRTPRANSWAFRENMWGLRYQRVRGYSRGPIPNEEKPRRPSRTNAWTSDYRPRRTVCNHYTTSGRSRTTYEAKRNLSGRRGVPTTVRPLTVTDLDIEPIKVRSRLYAMFMTARIADEQDNRHGPDELTN